MHSNQLKTLYSYKVFTVFIPSYQMNFPKVCELNVITDELTKESKKPLCKNNVFDIQVHLRPLLSVPERQSRTRTSGNFC